jgi:hypothetical protein
LIDKFVEQFWKENAYMIDRDGSNQLHKELTFHQVIHSYLQALKKRSSDPLLKCKQNGKRNDHIVTNKKV